jgi:hypothetical protein
MDGYVKARKGYMRHFLFGVFLAGFFAAFLFVYKPFGAAELFDGCGGLRYAFHFLMLACILFVSFTMTRTLFYAFNVGKRMLWWQYALWCIAEIFIAALFAALYTWLFHRNTMDYIDSVPYCLKYTFNILWLINEENKDHIEQLKSAPAGDSAPIKFTDEHGRLKLIIDAAEILYLNARTNYVDIYYLEAGRVKQFALRNSMKSIEEAVAEHGIVRCHRSFFVNPSHVKVLRKDKYGFVVAEFNIPEINPIPISKNYYEAIAELL